VDDVAGAEETGVEEGALVVTGEEDVLTGDERHLDPVLGIPPTDGAEIVGRV
jgi:hypothetical protein